jgi:hypothetical protein
MLRSNASKPITAWSFQTDSFDQFLSNSNSHGVGCLCSWQLTRTKPHQALCEKSDKTVTPVKKHLLAPKSTTPLDALVRAVLAS